MKWLLINGTDYYIFAYCQDEEETSLQAEARLFIALGNSKHENVVSLLGICSKQGLFLLFWCNSAVWML